MELIYGMLEKVEHVNVEHQDYPHHCRKPGKTPGRFKVALHKGQEKVRDEGYLDFGLVDFLIEVFS